MTRMRSSGDRRTGPRAQGRRCFAAATNGVDSGGGAAYNIPMESTLVRWLINTIALLLAVRFVSGISFAGEWWGMLFVSLLFGIVNTFLRPLVRFLAFPLLILSLGLFTFVINAMMLSVTAWLSGVFHLGFTVAGFKSALLGALLISLVSLTISCVIPPKDEDR